MPRNPKPKPDAAERIVRHVNEIQLVWATDHRMRLRVARYLRTAIRRAVAAKRGKR